MPEPGAQTILREPAQDLRQQRVGIRDGQSAEIEHFPQPPFDVKRFWELYSHIDIFAGHSYKESGRERKRNGTENREGLIQPMIKKIASDLKNNNQMLESALFSDEYFGSACRMMSNLMSASRKQNAPKLRDITASFVEANISAIQKNLKETHSKDNVERGFELLLNLISCGNDKQRDAGISILVENLGRDYSEDNKRLVFDGLERFIKKEVRFQAVKRVIKGVLGWYGLNYDLTMQAWEESTSPEKVPEIVKKNFLQVLKLEEKRPGITLILSKDFGINDFARYPIEMLIKQYDERENLELPYGIIMNARGDYNGFLYQNERVYQRLLEQLEDVGYGVRVLEAGTRYDIARKLITLDKKYGREAKISFGVFSGHGSETSIEFSELVRSGKEPGVFTKEDAQGRGVMRLSIFFIKDPTIILNSCLAGSEKGLVREISKIGGYVVGSKIEGNLQEIKVVRKEGKLYFKVFYYKHIYNPKTEEYTARYRGGQEVKE